MKILRRLATTAVAVLSLGAVTLPYARPFACGMAGAMAMDHAPGAAAWVAPGHTAHAPCQDMSGCAPASVAPVTAPWDGRLLAVITVVPPLPLVSRAMSPISARASPPPRV